MVNTNSCCRKSMHAITCTSRYIYVISMLYKLVLHKQLTTTCYSVTNGLELYFMYFMYNQNEALSDQNTYTCSAVVRTCIFTKVYVYVFNCSDGISSCFPYKPRRGIPGVQHTHITVTISTLGQQLRVHGQLISISMLYTGEPSFLTRTHDQACGVLRIFSYVRIQVSVFFKCLFNFRDGVGIQINASQCKSITHLIRYSRIFTLYIPGFIQCLHCYFHTVKISKMLCNYLHVCFIFLLRNRKHRRSPCNSNNV